MDIFRHLLAVDVVLLALCLTQDLGLQVHITVEIDIPSRDIEVLYFVLHAFADALLLICTLALQTRHAEYVGLDTACSRSRSSVDMDRHEEVALCLLGNPGAFGQRRVGVLLAGIDDLDIGILVFDESAHTLDDIERDDLFVFLQFAV